MLLVNFNFKFTLSSSLTSKIPRKVRPEKHVTKTLSPLFWPTSGELWHLQLMGKKFEGPYSDHHLGQTIPNKKFSELCYKLQAIQHFMILDGLLFESRKHRNKHRHTDTETSTEMNTETL